MAKLCVFKIYSKDKVEVQCWSTLASTLIKVKVKLLFVCMPSRQTKMEMLYLYVNLVFSFTTVPHFMKCKCTVGTEPPRAAAHQTGS